MGDFLEKRLREKKVVYVGDEAGFETMKDLAKVKVPIERKRMYGCNTPSGLATESGEKSNIFLRSATNRNWRKLLTHPALTDR